MDKFIKLHCQYLRYINRRPRSIKSREYSLLRLARYFENNYLYWDHCSYENLERYMMSKMLSPSTLAHEIGHIKGFYRWAKEQGYCKENPAIRLKRPKVHRGLPRPMADEDKIKALRNAPLRIQPWLYLSAFAGLRACEIAQLKGEDIIWDKNPPIILIREQKGGDTGMIPMHPVLAPILRQLPATGPLFPKYDAQHNQLEGTQITANQIQKHTNKYLRSQGIKATQHQLRHWFGTKCYQQSNRDLRLTQELMRHKSPLSTAIYTYVDPKEMANIVTALPVAHTDDGGYAA